VRISDVSVCGSGEEAEEGAVEADGEVLLMEKNTGDSEAGGRGPRERRSAADSSEA
jgi:hypothetical protein